MEPTPEGRGRGGGPSPWAGLSLGTIYTLDLVAWARWLGPPFMEMEWGRAVGSEGRTIF